MQNIVHCQVFHGSRQDYCIVVLGWAGASDKHVNKFSDIYSKQNFNVIQFTSKAETVGWGIENEREVSMLAEELMKWIKVGMRFIFHVISMNGFNTLCALDAKFQNLAILERTDGIFFDSCPIHLLGFNSDRLSEFVTLMNILNADKVNNPSVLERLKYRIELLGNMMKFTVHYITDDFLIKWNFMEKHQISTYFYLLQHQYLPRVISFVYSDNDKLCNSEHIHDFITKCSKRKDSGSRKIIETRFKDTRHVEHLRQETEKYLENVRMFLDNILNNRRETRISSKL